VRGRGTGGTARRVVASAHRYVSSPIHNQFYEKTSQGVRDQNLDGLACNLFSVGQERPQKKVQTMILIL